MGVGWLTFLPEIEIAVFMVRSLLVLLLDNCVGFFEPAEVVPLFEQLLVNHAFESSGWRAKLLAHVSEQVKAIVEGAKGEQLVAEFTAWSAALLSVV